MENKTDSLRSPAFFLSLVGCMFVGYLIYTVFAGENNDLKNFISGQIMGIGQAVFAYWVGSSASSQRKDDKILPMAAAVTTENGNGTNSR